MNKKCKLIKCLLDGDIINVSNSIRLTGYSNPAREVPREIEKPFSINVDKIKIESKDRHGNYSTWKNYKLNRIDPKNVVGVEKMRLYLAKHMEEYRPKPKDNPNPPAPDLFNEL